MLEPDDPGKLTGRELGKALIARGWRQGVVFSAPELACAPNVLSGAANAFQLAPRKVRTRERLILVSHDCDIESGDDPYVEALICKYLDIGKVKDASRLALLDRNSPRYFVVDPANGLIAEAKHRLLLEKKGLLRLDPDANPMEPVRHDRFVSWLGRRFDRPAVSEEIYESFHRPVLGVLEGMTPEMQGRFSAAVHDVRVRMPKEKAPPYTIGMLLILREQDLSSEGWEAIQEFENAVRREVAPEVVVLESEFVRRLESEVTYREVRVTQPIFLEHYSYQGEDIVGAVPLRP